MDYRWFRARLLAWGNAHRRDFSWRRPERTPFQVLVAEVLLQRSRGSTVEGVYREFLRRWPTPEKLARAREETIRRVITPLGLVGRARTLRLMGRAIEASGMPDSAEGLLALPGVGPYAANATAAVAFERRSPVVDGVTARVYRRFFGLSSDRPASTDQALWGLVAAATPREDTAEWNWAILDLAAAICLPAKPRCADCPLEARCQAALDDVRAQG